MTLGALFGFAAVAGLGGYFLSMRLFFSSKSTRRIGPVQAGEEDEEEGEEEGEEDGEEDGEDGEEVGEEDEDEPEEHEPRVKKSRVRCTRR